ncbi:TRAP transporter substrate-binding protein [Ideonella sp.]|uniref:TRAP transporter substrate-binding protein n=1 Tax=Ideonella sp. TaxID=1929293 RepID=UPI0035B37603
MTPARPRTLSFLAAALTLLAPGPQAAGTPPPAAPASAPAAAPAAPTHLRVVGGLAGLNQYTRHEEPFWSQELPRLSGGRLRADIVPFDRAGIRGQDMLRLVQLGVVPFGTVLLSLSAADEPLIGAPDLAGLNPDAATLRRHATAYRPFLEKMLRERHGIELLAVYTYPAQMLFCKRPVKGLNDLAGRRVRTSSPTQSDWIEALGGKPVAMPFAELGQALRNGSAECAITGSMSGYTIGLHKQTSHLYTMPVTWGMSIFAANAGAWAALPADLRPALKQELLRLEQAIWAESDRETGEGVRCLTGASAAPGTTAGTTAGACAGGTGAMRAQSPTAADEQRRRDILATVTARWVKRCGPACADAWQETLAPLSGIDLRRSAARQP